MRACPCLGCHRRADAVPVYARPSPEQAYGGPHVSRVITVMSPTPRTLSHHKALNCTYALTLEQLDARGRLLRHVPCGTGNRQRLTCKLNSVSLWRGRPRAP
jgi:hypothetical protein